MLSLNMHKVEDALKTVFLLEENLFPDLICYFIAFSLQIILALNMYSSLPLHCKCHVPIEKTK